MEERSTKSEGASKLDLLRAALIPKFGIVGVDNLIAALADAVDEDFHHRCQWSNCTKCNLHKTRARVVYGSGPSNASVLVIGEAPGAEEDQKGVPFSGPTGTFLRETMERIGIPSSKVFFTNSVACIPRNTQHSHFRAPTSEEMTACQPRLNNILESVTIQREVTLLVGKPGYVSYVCRKAPDEIEHMLKRVRMMDILGWQDIDSDVIPSYVIYHPSYIMRRNDRTTTQKWVDSLKVLKKYLEERHAKRQSSSNQE